MSRTWRGVPSSQEIEQAIITLYTHPTPSAKHTANVYLMDFQTMPYAWDISKQILVSPLNTTHRSECQFFAANTLYSKVINEWLVLTVDDKKKYTEMIMELLKDFSLGAPTIRTRLCLALSSIIIHSTPQIITQPLVYDPDNNTNTNGNDRNNGYTTSSLLEILFHMVSNIRVLREPALEVLSYLPEEYEKAVLPMKKRELCKTELNKALPTLLSFLSSVLQEDALEAKIVALKCFLYWISWGVFLPTLFSTTLIDQTLKIILETPFSSKILFETAIDSITEIFSAPHGVETIGSVEKTRLCFDQKEYLGNVKNIVTHLLGLKPVYQQAFNAKNSDICRNIIKVFSTIGASYTSLIFEGSQIGFDVLSIILQGASHYDKKILELTIDFWEILAEKWVEGNRQGKITPNVSSVIQQVFVQLTNIILQQISYPENYSPQPNNNNNNNSNMNNSNFNTDTITEEIAYYQEIVVGAIFASCVVLTSVHLTKYLRDTLNDLVNNIQTPGSWQKINSILYFVYVLGERLSIEDMLRDIPSILNLSLSLHYHPILSLIVIHLIEGYSELVCKDSNLVLSSINFILTQITQQNDPLKFSSCEAFSVVCDKSRIVLVNVLDNMISGVENAISLGMEVEQRELLVQGLICVVTSAPSTEVPRYLKRISLPIVSKINELLVSPPSLQNKSLIKNELYVLSAIFSAESISLFSLLQDSWGVIDNITKGVYRNESDIIVAVCRIISNAFVNSADMITLIPLLLTTLTNSYTISSTPACLDTISAIFQGLNIKSEPTSVPFFNSPNATHFITHFSSTISFVSDFTFRLIRSNPITSYLEIIESYFSLITQILTVFPDLILVHLKQYVETITQLSVFCSVLKERDPALATYSFLIKLLEFTSMSPEIQTFLNTLGNDLVRGMLNSISSSSDQRLLSFISNALHVFLSTCSLFPELNHKVIGWVTTLLKEETFVPRLTIEDRERLFKVIFSLVGKKQRFKALVLDFSNVCNGVMSSDVFVSYEM